MCREKEEEHTMKQIAVPFVVVMGLIVLPLATASAGALGQVPVAAAAPAPLLTGETFQPGTLTLNGSCVPVDMGNSSFSFNATGTATGPVSGTYTESGSFTTGLDTSNMTTILAFNATFSIVSGGKTVATGTVTLASPQPATSFGLCFFAQPNVDAMLDYTATVGGYQLAGQAEVMIGPSTSSPTQSTFQQTFESSSTVSCFTSIGMPFNSIPIPGNSFIWMPAVLQIHGPNASAPSIINFTGQTITFTANGTTYTYKPPDGSTTFSSTATTASTSYDPVTNTWNTTVPLTIGGKSYFTGIEIPVPATGLPGGIKPVTWSGQISSGRHGVTVHWQWGAAVYTTFSPEYNSLGVKPVDDPNASVYQNSDNAGTPENFKQYVTGGARGGGGNPTGSWSATGSCTT
jgi:hypothetical protein